MVVPLLRTSYWASGARLVTTLVNALEQEHQHTGIATACIGGGLGIALMIEKEYINMKSLDKTFVIYQEKIN